MKYEYLNWRTFPVLDSEWIPLSAKNPSLNCKLLAFSGPVWVTKIRNYLKEKIHSAMSNQWIQIFLLGHYLELVSKLDTNSIIISLIKYR